MTVPAVPEEDLARMAVWGADTAAMLDSLRTVVRSSTERYLSALEREKANIARREAMLAAGEVLSTRDTGLDPQVSQLGRFVFDKGTQLLKLIDPVLAASGAARINIAMVNGTNGHGTATSATADPRVLVAGLMAELTRAGVDTESVTPEVVLQILARGSYDPAFAEAAAHPVIDIEEAAYIPRPPDKPRPVPVDDDALPRGPLYPAMDTSELI